VWHWQLFSSEKTTDLITGLLFSDWRWARGQRQREEYISILNAFIDKKDSYYSIHQIGESWVSDRLQIDTGLTQAVKNLRYIVSFVIAAQMGVGEGKPIGQWYGPNTVAQVLK